MWRAGAGSNQAAVLAPWGGASLSRAPAVWCPNHLPHPQPWTEAPAPVIPGDSPSQHPRESASGTPPAGLGECSRRRPEAHGDRDGGSGETAGGRAADALRSQCLARPYPGDGRLQALGLPLRKSRCRGRRACACCGCGDYCGDVGAVAAVAEAWRSGASPPQTPGKPGPPPSANSWPGSRTAGLIPPRSPLRRRLFPTPWPGAGPCRTKCWPDPGGRLGAEGLVTRRITEERCGSLCSILFL